MANFNTEQEKAIHFYKGPFRCIAGPGSGKTTVIVNRTKNLISEHGVNPESILVVTFTKAAAEEMKERYIKLYDEMPNVMPTFCTIHSFCLNVLMNANLYRVSDILRAAEGFTYMKNLVKQDDNVEVSDVNRFVENILSRISYTKNMEQTPEETAAFFNDRKKGQKFITYFYAYEQFKQDNRKIDFDDMLIYTKKLFHEDAKTLDYWRSRYKFLMIDEFQDTNSIQADILYMLAAPDNNIFIVGDDDQSLYEFRGATPSIMIDFSKSYPNYQEATLNVNYRSEASIIRNSGKLIANNEHRLGKNIVGCKTEEGTFEYLKSHTESDEVSRLSEQVKKQMEKYSPKEIAVLCRTNREVSMVAKKFSDEKIPFYAKDAIKNPHDTWIFKVLMQYVDIAMNIDREKNVLAVINKPSRYLSKFVYDKTDGNFEKMYKNINFSDQPEHKKKWLRSIIHEFESDIKYAEHYTAKNAGDYLKFIYNQFGLQKFVTDYCEYVWEDADEIFYAVNQFFEEAEKYKNIRSYREYVETSDNEFEEKMSGDYDGACISTMHRAKGLEWDCVNIINLNERRCPYIPAEKKDDINSLYEMESERRAFYVAVTRAKKECVLYSYTEKDKSGGGNSKMVKEGKTAVSRFIGDIGLVV